MRLIPVLTLAAGLLTPTLVHAQMRNAPSPRALEFAAYIFSAANVCGYRIGVEQFDALLEKQNVRAADVGPRGPHGAQVQTIFTMMSNQMQLNREKACIAVAGEYGPEGNIARNVLLPASVEAPPAPETPSAPKPAQ
ncbi:MAG TPA: hypothetical protein VF641_10190 [Methylobacterium sp.]|jgi:hypothetical protein